MARHLRRPGEPELTEGMRLLDRYSILDRIGSGGMATIYRATDDRLDRVVCVKLLRTTLVEGSGSTSGSNAVYQATYSHFLQEALALSKLQHPNTLRIYDFGYVDAPADPETGQPGGHGAPFHVSEYLDGGNLESLVRLRGATSPEESLGILEGISGAVAEAHEHGILHRDIKPSNIIFARVRGTLVPKLADFGIAHSDLKKRNPQRDVGEGESVSTVALFSPRWAAPEQLCGSQEGPRTDVYALGLLTTFMLVGRVLFGDEDVRTTFNDRVRGDTLVNARLAQLGFHGEVLRVLTRSMIARPDDRIATAPEFYDQLRDALRIRQPSSVAPLRAEPAQETYSTAAQAQMQPRASAAQPAPQPPHAPSVPGRPPSAVPPPPAPALTADAGSRLALEEARAPDGHEGFADSKPQPAPERVQSYGERLVRYAQVHEKLDLSFLDEQGGQVRVRVTMLPRGGPNMPPKLNVKGLSCFVAKHGQRPTPALTVSQDGSVEMISVAGGGRDARNVLGELAWVFPEPNAQANAWLFVVDGRQLLVPYTEAQEAVALMLSRGNDLVVMCRR